MNRDWFNHCVQTTRLSWVTVDCNRSMSWVRIASPLQEVFLQGDDASEFIANCDKTWDELQDVSMEDVEIYFAYDYLVLFE